MGLIVTTLPDTLTKPDPTAIVSAVAPPVLNNVMFPLSASTLSLNVKTIFASTATPVALSAGELETRVGETLSAADVKFSVVASAIPA